MAQLAQCLAVLRGVQRQTWIHLIAVMLIYIYIYMLFIDMSIDFDKPKQGSSMFLLRGFIDI